MAERVAKNRPVFVIIGLLLPVVVAASFWLGRRSSIPDSDDAAPAHKTATEGDAKDAKDASDAKDAKDSEDAKGGGAADKDKDKDKAITFSEEAAKSAGIVVTPVVLQQVTATIPFNGQISVSPNSTARLSPVVPGRIARLMVGQGDAVRAGQAVAIIESRSIGDAQAAYSQAQARLQNAQTNLQVVLQQVRAGVFSHTPLETARKAQVDAASDVRTQETAVRQARVAYDNAVRLTRVGNFSSPALETARGNASTANEALRAAQAALDNANAAVTAAQTALDQRRQLAAAGTYQTQPVQQAEHALTAAQAARAAAQSEVTTTSANLARAKALSAEGLISQRDLEAAQGAYDQAITHQTTAQSDEATARQELERQRKIASTNVMGATEVQTAQAALVTAQADVRTRTAEVERARAALRLANVALSREQAIFQQGIANRREISTARATLATAQTALFRARQTLGVTTAALQREQNIYHQNLNNIVQVQTARATYVQAQADAKAARNALSLLKSAPGGSVMVPLTTPISGVVQDASVTVGAMVDTTNVLMTVVNLSTVALEAALPENDFARVRYGGIVQATIDALPGRTFTGRITYLSPAIDPTTRTATARAVLNNPGVLHPGMFAHGRIQASNTTTSLAVPSDAVQNLDGKPVVFAASDKPNEFVPKEVQTGATIDKQTVIIGGLKPGERIVTQGAFMVKAQSMKGAEAD